MEWLLSLVRQLVDQFGLNHKEETGQVLISLSIAELENINTTITLYSTSPWRLDIKRQRNGDLLEQIGLTLASPDLTVEAVQRLGRGG
jgi:hypothetical protein